MLRKFSIVFVCGFVGGGLREIIELIFKNSAPLATLAINLVGALFMGMAYEYIVQAKHDTSSFALIIGTGLIGSFTTFATFIADMHELMITREILNAVCYLTASVVFGILLLLMGRLIVRSCYHVV